MPNTKLSDAAKLAERLRKAVEEKTCLIDHKQVSLTASFGIAAYTPDMKDLDDLFRASDTAMYQAKKEGRNRVVTIEKVE
ncbi:MAG: GGDEF domain-containing protein [Anaerolineales bacterium]|nr:GGDEF domain-containing protein [Anaerolineales bacterium]